MADGFTRLTRLLEPRSIAVVGASEREKSFGNRMTTEVLRSPSAPRVTLVHPAYGSVHGRPCVPSLLDVDGPVDLVVLGVPDVVLSEQLAHAATRGDGAAVVFGTAHGIGAELASIASKAGMSLCGGGSMGYVNVARGIRAIGYVERFPLTSGGIACVTHSGSVFSALLRTHRRLEYSVIVSSGQELVTSMAEYLDYALGLPETRVIGLFVETLRDVAAFREGLARAAEQDMPVVALTVGGSPTGRTLVAAHSGAVAGDDAAWEALFSAYGVHRVESLDEMVDTLELFSIGRRVRPGSAGGLATVHDSGGQRALIADRADALGVEFAELSVATRDRIAGLLDPGLEPTNPLDVWGRGADTETLFTAALEALADDDAVAVVAAGLDLAEEYDEDQSYPRALAALIGRTDKPVVVLNNLAAALDQKQARYLRGLGVPVLEGTESGLRAVRHLIDAATAVPERQATPVDHERTDRWRARLAGDLSFATCRELVGDYGINTVASLRATSRDEALAAAERLGFPLVMKTDAAGVLHKTDVSGVRVALADNAAVGAAYDEIACQLGPIVTVQPHVDGVEVSVGMVRDPLLGPLIVVALGGTLVELIGQRKVALPPLSYAAAESLLNSLPLMSALLAGVRGAKPARHDAVVDAVVAMSQLASELGDRIEALEVNPLICGPSAALAVDVLVVPRGS